MRNKYRHICCGVMIVLLCFSGGIFRAHGAAEKQYIVEFRQEAALFASEREGPSLNLLTESQLQECLEQGIVAWYEEDYEVELLDAEAFADTTQSTADTGGLKWDLSMIQAGRARELLCEGQDVNVGIIDSGIMQHPDLKDSIKPGYNYLRDNEDVTDNIGHGTFVAGMIAANESAVGIAGVAEEINIIPLKCFDTNETTLTSTVCLAIKAAVDVYDCDIINMSLGLNGNSQKLMEHIKYATDAGVIVVAAVGNLGSTALYYPAAYEQVIGVGSVNADGMVSGFSQYNSSVDFVAPGEAVWSTGNNGGYMQKSGTSFSAPLVTGVIASMLSVDDTLTHDEIVSLLAQTATVRQEWTDGEPFVRNDDYGHGLVNVSACLDRMLEDRTYFISPIDFDEETTRVVIVNHGETPFEGYCMWGEYTSRGMKNMDWEYVSIPAGGSVTADTFITGNRIKCFLWRDITDISVVTDFREREAS